MSLFTPQHTFASTLKTLIQGLEEGSIVLRGPKKDSSDHPDDHRGEPGRNVETRKAGTRLQRRLPEPTTIPDRQTLLLLGLIGLLLAPALGFVLEATGISSTPGGTSIWSVAMVAALGAANSLVLAFVFTYRAAAKVFRRQVEDYREEIRYYRTQIELNRDLLKEQMEMQREPQEAIARLLAERAQSPATQGRGDPATQGEATE